MNDRNFYEMVLEHTTKDDFNLEEHQQKSRIEAIKYFLNENKQLQQELDKEIKEKIMIEFNFDKKIKENKVDYELKLIKANELLDKSIKTTKTLEKEVKKRDEVIEKYKNMRTLWK